MPLDENLFAAKLKYLQRGGGCYKKKKKKGDKFDIMQKPSLLLFLIIKRRYFDQKLPEKSDKNGPDTLQ